MQKVGLKQAEINALVDLNPAELQNSIRKEEVFWVKSWIQKVYKDTEFIKKISIDNLYPSVSPYSPVQISAGTRRSRNSIREHLVYSGFKLAEKALLEYDPCLNHEFSLSGNGSDTITIEVEALLPKIRYVVSKTRPLPTDPYMRNYELALRYTRRLQLWAMKLKLPVTVVLDVAVNRDRFVEFQKLGLTACKLVWTFRHSIPRANTERFNLTDLDQLGNLYDSVVRDPAGPAGGGYLTGTRANDLFRSGADLDHTRVSDRYTSTAEEFLATMVSTRIVFYIEEFITVIKTLTRFKMLSSYPE